MKLGDRGRESKTKSELNAEMRTAQNGACAYNQDWKLRNTLIYKTPR